jgi:hypothetical protein
MMSFQNTIVIAITISWSTRPTIECPNGKQFIINLSVCTLCKFLDHTQKLESKFGMISYILYFALKSLASHDYIYPKVII